MATRQEWEGAEVDGARSRRKAEVAKVRVQQLKCGLDRTKRWAGEAKKVRDESF